MLSKTCNYGIRAVLYIAAQKNRKFVPIREISNNLSISFHFLTKILQMLTLDGILTSFRGPNGGVALAKPAENISIMDIIASIDGSDLFTECLMGLDRCGDEVPCPLHQDWIEIRDKLVLLFQKTSLNSFSEKVAHHEFRLAN